MNGSSRNGSTKLETAALVHLGIMVLGASWLFGGNIWWMRTALAWFAPAGALLTLGAFLRPGDAGRQARRRAWYLLPLALFVSLVVASLFNPAFSVVTFADETRLAYRGEPHPGWPTTAIPGETLRELAFAAGAYLSAFNLLLVVRRRAALRGLLVVVVSNAMLLAVFGTIQKLGAQGFYFGASTSPNVRFFSTFIYYNHWGAFMALMLAGACGLAFYFTRDRAARDVWHSPFPLFAAGALFLAASAPVSASRAATIMALGLVLVATVHLVFRIVASRRSRGRTIGGPLAALTTAFALVVASVAWLSSHSIMERYAQTRDALSGKQTLWDGRMEIYRDTIELALRKPVFGWGLESYGTAIFLIRPRPLEPRRQYESSYTEAHSDWLQSFAETGVVGTALVVLMAAVPLVSLRGAHWRHPLVAYPLLGCAVVATYAWVEFPFANGAVLLAFWALFFAALRYAQLLPSRS